MKTILVAAGIVLLLTTAGQAATLKFPSEAPIAAITIPDDWDPTETETGIEATSPDTAIYFAIDVADEKTSDKVIEDAVTFLEENGVTIDDATQKQSEEIINGMEMSNFDWSGTDSDGDVSIGLSVLSPSAGKLLVITYWGSKSTQAAHAQALLSIISSLQAVKE